MSCGKRGQDLLFSWERRALSGKRECPWEETAKHGKTAKVCMVCFSLFVPFALFAVHDFQPACPQKF